MEVSGRKGKVKQSPGDKRVIFCNPCKYNDQINDADGFCETCKEYLCQSCVAHHRSLRVTRNHVINDKSTMPLDVTVQVQSDVLCTDVCEQHRDRFIEFFCQTHDVFGCSVCTTVNHRSCKINFIPDIAKNFKNEQEYKTLIQSLEQLETTTEQCKKDIENNLEIVDKTHAVALEDIRKFRAEINEYLDKREKEILDMARQTKEQDQQLMGTLQRELQRIDKEIKDAKTQLNDSAEKLAKLFVICKGAKVDIGRLQGECSSLTTRMKIGNYRFKPSPDIKQMVISKGRLGELENVKPGVSRQVLTRDRDVTAMKLVSDGKITCKSPEDTKDPIITGLVLLSPDRLLATDYNNNALKIIDTRRKAVTSRTALLGRPWDVTCLPDDQAAVTILYEKKIQIISTRESVSLVRDFSVNGRCMGICYVDGKLVVTHQSPVKVEILNLDGVVLKALTQDVNNQPLFNNPTRVIVETLRDGRFLYVSDYGGNTVIKLNIDGKVLNQYHDKPLNAPDGIILIDDIYLAVCNRKGNQIIVLHDDGGTMKIVQRWDCVSKPMAIVYCAQNDTLFVSSDKRGQPLFLHVYKLTL